MTKLSEVCLRQKNSFITPYGRNRWQKNGRAMEKNPPTLGSILKEKEKEEEMRAKPRESTLNCKGEIDTLLNCLRENGKDQISLCSAHLQGLGDCYQRLYSGDLAAKMYHSQVDFILKNFN